MASRDVNLPMTTAIRHFVALVSAAITAVVMPVAALCGDSSPAYNFLNIPSSSRIYGLGGVNISSVDAGILAVEQNPALLGPEYEGAVGLGYMRYIGGSNFASAAFGNRSGDRSAYGAAIRYFGYGDIPRTDATGADIGSFSPKDLSISATYSRDITEMLRGGATLKWLYSSYDSYTAMAIAVDLGINFYEPDRDLSLSAAVVNLGGQIKRFNEVYERLPVDVRLGWTQSFPGLPVRFSITAWNLTKWHLPYYETGDGSSSATPELKQSFASDLFRHLVFAADFIPSDRFNIGIGYNYKTRTDMATYSRNILSGFSIGAGLHTEMWGVGVAFAQPHRGAATLMINLTASIGRLLK